MTTGSPPRQARFGFRAKAAFLDVRGREVLTLTALSVLSGLIQAAVLLIVVRTAANLSAEAAALEGSFGPFDLSGASVGGLLGTGAALVVGASILELWSASLTARLVSRTQRSVRSAVLLHFTEADWATQQGQRRGELDQLLTTNVNQASSVVLGTSTGIAALASFLALLSVALLIDAFAAALVVGGLVGLLLLVRPITSRTKKMSLQYAASNRQYASTLSEHISLLKELRAFGVVDGSRRAIDEVNLNTSRMAYRSRFLSKASASLFRMTALLLLLLVLAVVNALGASDLLALTGVVLLLVRSLAYGQAVQAAYHSIGESSGWVDDLMARDEAHRQHRDVRDQARESSGLVSGSLVVRNVAFRYAADRPALCDITFDVEEGEALGIVGPSGAGKTTLMELLLALRSPTSGDILLGGRPASEVSAADWHAAVAFVPQEAHLLRDSVADNVRFYRPGISDDMVTEALRLARIDGEVASWPQGFLTPVGELGTSISGGQRQRIALARALVGQPKLLLLDEPTSSLDGRSEALITETLHALRGSVTLVIVAHRLSTLGLCDRILVLERGEITALGTPAEIGDASDFYRDIRQRSIPRSG